MHHCRLGSRFTYCNSQTKFCYINHRFIVPVMVNGQGPFTFLLDTGTQITIVDPSMVGLMHLSRPVGKSQVAGMGVRVQQWRLHNSRFN